MAPAGDIEDRSDVDVVEEDLLWSLDVDSGWSLSCAVEVGGNVMCWGGDPSGGDAWSPVPVRGINDAVAVSVGYLDACAIHATGEVSCWQGPDGTPGKVGGLTDVDEISVGWNHRCARQGGDVRCWGRNWAGQLGDGTTTDRGSPVLVSGLTDARQLALGDDYTCARRATGRVVCWGEGSLGQIGNGSRQDRLAPTTVSGLTSVTSLDAQSWFTCAVQNREPWCWGGNQWGQLGAGEDDAHSAVPVRITGISDAVQIGTGGDHACVRKAGGSVRCWGYNEQGGLGDGTTTSRSTHAAVSNLADVNDLAVGSLHTCARVSGFVTSAIWCWGGNRRGQVGDGTTTNRRTPVQTKGDEYLPNGGACSSGTLCQSGNCVDGVCCNSTCGNGSATDCMACSKNAGAPGDGTCRALSSSRAPNVVCRQSAGPCDPAETCSASSTACPTNRLTSSGTSCRAASGACDVAEVCTGASAACPSNGFAASGTSCRAASGVCDAAEVCNGSSGACPSNAMRPAGSACRTAAGACDAVESCNGTSSSCPADVLLAAGVVCRPSLALCDPAEACPDNNASCPADFRFPFCSP